MISLASLLKSWVELPVVVIDFETTGVDPAECMPVEIACARIEGGKVVAEHSALINPGVPISEGAIAVHGITEEMVKDAGKPAVVIELALQAVDAWECLPAGYNGHFFDRTILQRIVATTRESGLASHPHWPWLDPLVAIREVDRFVKGKGRHQLGKVCERRGIKLEGAHRALADVKATAALLFHFDVLNWLGKDSTPTETLRRQMRFAEAQERSFQEWKARQPQGAPAGGE
jgi:DNA polymerase-3 subunit epsilon